MTVMEVSARLSVIQWLVIGKMTLSEIERGVGPVVYSVIA